jgi:hypothetical protein
VRRHDVSRLHPRLASSATPVSVFPLSLERSSVPHELGLTTDQMHPVGDALFSARIDVPLGEWLVWIDAGYAMWIGGRVDALPAPVRRRLDDGDTAAVGDLVDALADVGVWLREAALLIDGDWTPSRRANSALSEIATRIVSALSGIFVDRSGHSARLEVARGGVCWTDRPALVIEWLLTTVDLPAPQ